jgi:hypothetical protein
MESTEAKELHDTNHDADGHGAEHHHDPGFWRKYIFSTDHKIIGIQYGITSLLFMLVGFFLIATMRWSIAYPGSTYACGWIFPACDHGRYDLGGISIQRPRN